jgi:LacI family transcriptional regulator
MSRALVGAVRPASGRPTIGDVALRSGVSTATVSRVLSGGAPTTEATRARVLEAVEQLGYRPSAVARALKGRSTHTIGLVITDIQNPFYPEIVRAVEEAARERGWLVLLCNAGQDPARQRAELELLIDRQVDGLIVAASRIERRHADWLAAAPVPAVLVNCRAHRSGLASVESRNRAGARTATRHLLELGHLRIGYVGSSTGDAAAAERLAGIRDVLRPGGLLLQTATADGHVVGAEVAARELLLRNPELTAVLAYNDLTAIGVLRAARAAGMRIPRDLSVVGFDDIDLAAWLDPPLTTVRQQKTALGRWAVETLARLGSGVAGDPPATRRLDTPLVIRGSTAPPPPRAQRSVPKEPRPTR